MQTRQTQICRHQFIKYLTLIQGILRSHTFTQFKRDTPAGTPATYTTLAADTSTNTMTNTHIEKTKVPGPMKLTQTQVRTPANTAARAEIRIWLNKE